MNSKAFYGEHSYAEQVNKNTDGKNGQVAHNKPIFVLESGFPNMPIEFRIAGRLLAVSIDKAKIIHRELSDLLKKYESA